MLPGHKTYQTTYFTASMGPEHDPGHEHKFQMKLSSSTVSSFPNYFIIINLNTLLPKVLLSTTFHRARRHAMCLITCFFNVFFIRWI
jgi:hypothetical protein